MIDRSKPKPVATRKFRGTSVVCDLYRKPKEPKDAQIPKK